MKIRHEDYKEENTKYRWAEIEFDLNTLGADIESGVMRVYGADTTKNKKQALANLRRELKELKKLVDKAVDTVSEELGGSHG